MAACTDAIISQDYADYIVEYGGIKELFMRFTRRTASRSLMNAMEPFICR